MPPRARMEEPAAPGTHGRASRQVLYSVFAAAARRGTTMTLDERTPVDRGFCAGDT